MVMKLCPIAARIWSAVTCHRFWRFGDLSPKQGRVQRPARAEGRPPFDGDKSPAKSADKSPHSRVVAALPGPEKSRLLGFRPPARKRWERRGRRFTRLGLRFEDALDAGRQIGLGRLAVGCLEACAGRGG